MNAPLSSRVRQLPNNHIGFLIGSQRYFYANYTYYLWDNRRDYIVVEESVGAETEVASASESSGELFVLSR